MPVLPLISADRAAWRPQSARASRMTRPVVDPIVEPLWEGIHVLAHVTQGAARLIDAAGDDVGREFAAITAALGVEVAARDAVIDGWLTEQATRSGEGLALVPIEPPRGMGILRPQRPGPPRAVPHDRPGTIAFVAVDLLALDDEMLLDVPLLERKRLLDSVIVGSDLVRSSPYVRPPVERWLPSWQAVGFKGAVLKGANGRYVPGGQAEDWSVVRPVPRR